MSHTLMFELHDKVPIKQVGAFFVPQNCSGISFTHTIDTPYSMLVILMIRDNHGRLRFQKQLGHSSKTVYLGETAEYTTIGGIPGKINSGQWTLEFIFNQEYGKYFDGSHIHSCIEIQFSEGRNETEMIDGPIWVDEDFNYSFLEPSKIYQRGTKWYKGDFHTHTQLSDGRDLPRSVVEKVIAEQNLDFYLATEHNLLHTGWPETSLMVLPGIEITTGQGHANLFGLTKRPESLDALILAHQKEDVLQVLDELIAEAKVNGWLFSINHPFLYLWKWLHDTLSLDLLDCIEIINDPTYELEEDANGRLANQQAVELADLFWSQGYRICAIGGRDSHMVKGERYPSSKFSSIPGDPATWVYMENLTPNNLYSALRQCRAYVTRFSSLDFEFIQRSSEEVNLGTLSFGDQLHAECAFLDYRLSLKMDFDEALLFCYIDGQKVELTTEVSTEGVYTASGRITLNEASYQWIRFGATNQDGDFRFYGNALTKGHRVPDIRTFRQAKEKLGISG